MEQPEDIVIGDQSLLGAAWLAAVDSTPDKLHCCHDRQPTDCLD